MKLFLVVGNLNMVMDESEGREKNEIGFLGVRLWSSFEEREEQLQRKIEGKCV